MSFNANIIRYLWAHIGRKLIVIIIIQAHRQFMHLHFTSMVLILQCRRNIFTKVAETQSDSQSMNNKSDSCFFFCIFWKRTIVVQVKQKRKGSPMVYVSGLTKIRKRTGSKLNMDSEEQWDNRDLHKFMQLTYDTEITQFGQRLKVSARNRNSKNTQHKQKQKHKQHTLHTHAARFNKWSKASHKNYEVMRCICFCLLFFFSFIILLLF